MSRSCVRFRLVWIVHVKSRLRYWKWNIPLSKFKENSWIIILYMGPSIKDVGIFLAVFVTPSPMSEFWPWFNLLLPSNILQHRNLSPPSPLKYSDVFYGWMAPMLKDVARSEWGGASSNVGPKIWGVSNKSRALSPASYIPLGIIHAIHKQVLGFFWATSRNQKLPFSGG